MRTRLILLCGLFSAVLPVVHASEFDDIDDDDIYAEAIEYVHEEGIVEGYSDDMFRPYQHINRAELLKIVMETTDADTGGKYCFWDVGSQWFAQYVCGARDEGIVEGYADGSFRPAHSVTLAEAAALIVRAYEEDIDDEDGPWYVPYLDALDEWDAMPPTTGYYNDPLTRGEMAYIIWKIEEGDHDNDDDDNHRDVDFEPFFDYDDNDIEDLEDIDDLPSDDVEREDLIAWDHVLMGIVKRRAYAPPMNARAYGALAIAQRDVIVIGDEVGASSKDAIDQVSRDVLCYLFPLDCGDLNIDFNTDEYSREVSSLVSAKMIQRLSQDRTDIVLTPPVGPCYWTGTDPIGSYVLNWNYLLIDEDEVYLPAPPACNSDEDLDEIEQVRDALEDLTAEQLADAFKWDYAENVTLLFADIAHDYLDDEDADIRRTADVRMVLYASIADGFTAAWKGKYTYWTARPAQRDARIDPVLPTPNFPSYPSGHSTLSGAGYGALKYFYPSKEHDLHEMGVTNRDAREWSGVHFRVDDIEGMKLGEEVAEEVIRWYEDQ